MAFSKLLKQPSAFVPLLMSVGALAVLGIALARLGLQRIHQPDEGAAAHLWQLLMGGQLPIIAFFAFKWLPREPRPAIAIMALQALAGVAAAAPVFLLKL